MPKYATLAVDALATTFVNQFDTELRAVEADNAELVNLELEPLEDIIKASVPFDNRSPLLQIFDEDGAFLEQGGQRHDFSLHDITVALNLTSKGTEIELAEVTIRHYMTAMIRVVKNNPRLEGVAGIVAAIVTDFDRASFGDDSITRHIRAIGVEVHVQNGN